MLGGSAFPTVEWGISQVGGTFKLVACGSAKLVFRHFKCMVNRIGAVFIGEQTGPCLLLGQPQFICPALWVQLPCFNCMFLNIAAQFSNLWSFENKPNYQYQFGVISFLVKRT